MLFIYQALIYDDNTQIRILAGHAKKISLVYNHKKLI